MSDPTIQSPLGNVPADRESFLVSLAEIDAMGLKAARGCGYTWGLAQEAGRAARWLAAYGLPGPERLSATLEDLHGTLVETAPKRDGGRWYAPAGRLCPVALGAGLSDRAEALAAGERISAEAVLHPLLLLPFLSRAARDLDCSFQISSRRFAFVATPQGPICTDWQGLSDSKLADLEVACTEETSGQPRSYGWRAYPVRGETWRQLDAWAQRTYVPATAASRQSGAGAGTTDND